MSTLSSILTTKLSNTLLLFLIFSSLLFSSLLFSSLLFSSLLFSSLLLSCLVLSCLVLSCLVLSCLVFSSLLFSSLLFSSLLFCPLLFSPLILPYLILYYLIPSVLFLSYLILSYLILSYLILSCLILACNSLTWPSLPSNSEEHPTPLLSLSLKVDTYERTCPRSETLSIGVWLYKTRSKKELRNLVVQTKIIFPNKGPFVCTLRRFSLRTQFSFRSQYPPPKNTRGIVALRSPLSRAVYLGACTG